MDIIACIQSLHKTQFKANVPRLAERRVPVAGGIARRTVMMAYTDPMPARTAAGLAETGTL